MCLGGADQFYNFLKHQRCPFVQVWLTNFTTSFFTSKMCVCGWGWWTVKSCQFWACHVLSKSHMQNGVRRNNTAGPFLASVVSNWFLCPSEYNWLFQPILAFNILIIIIVSIWTSSEFHGSPCPWEITSVGKISHFLICILQGSSFPAQLYQPFAQSLTRIYWFKKAPLYLGGMHI